MSELWRRVVSSASMIYVSYFVFDYFVLGI